MTNARQRVTRPGAFGTVPRSLLAAVGTAVFMCAAPSARAAGPDGAGGPATPAAAESATPGARARCVVDLRTLGEIPGSDSWGLEAPAGLAVDHRGDILIADTGNDRVVTVSPGGEVVREFGGFGWGDDELDGPTGLAVYTGFYTYVLDEGNRRIQRYDADGDFLDTLVGQDEAGSPVDLAVGIAGEILIVDEDSQAVLARSQFDEMLTPIGRFGTGEGGLVRPRHVAWGPGRRIAVSDAGSGTVEVFDEFGSGLFSLSSPDTLEPGDLLFDPSGSVIVSDLRHGRVLVFPPNGGFPTASFGEGPEALRPSALAIDREGRLLVLDGVRGRVLAVEIVHGACPSGR